MCPPCTEGAEAWWLRHASCIEVSWETWASRAAGMPLLAPGAWADGHLDRVLGGRETLEVNWMGSREPVAQRLGHIEACFEKPSITYC